MNFKIIGRFIAQILTIEGFFMIPAVLISVFAKEQSAVYGFLIAIAAIALAAALLSGLCRRAPRALDAREGMVCVGGVCRVVPASSGFSLSITTSF